VQMLWPRAGQGKRRIEEGGTEPTIVLLRRLAAAPDADVRLTAGHDLGSVRFEPHAARTLAPRTGALMPN
jgi:hypothetical protein